MIRRRIISILRKNEDIFFAIKYLRLRFLMFIFRNVSDSTYIKWQYRLRTGRRLDLETPVLYNEKVQYSKLNCRDAGLKKLVDKAEVRSFVNAAIGEKYLTRLYGVYDSVDDINFDDLPDRFVIKLTNGSGFNYICRKKTESEAARIRRMFRRWLRIDYFALGREWAYKDVRNRIICEELLETDDPRGVCDYKVFCFDGIPRFIQVDFDRFGKHRRNIYTPDWEFLNERIEYENDPDAVFPKPMKLQEMLECARRLSAGFKHVRTDFFIIDTRLVFSEMTFYHGAGYLRFGSEAFERQLGDYWVL